MFVDDAAFVRAPAELAYRRLTEIRAWPTWWSGLEVRSLPPAGVAERWALDLSAGPAFRLRLGVTCLEWRHASGFTFAVDGDLVGRGEFWLEPLDGGTVVHHLLVATTGLHRPLRVRRGYRRGVRRGLWGLKDVLQLEVRTSLGVTP